MNKSMKFYHIVKLKKDLPTYKKGWEFKWSGNHNAYFPRAVSEWKHDNGHWSIYLDYKHQSYTLDEVADKEWFEPVGKAVDFIPPFPKKEKLEEYVYLLPETRLVNDVDFCRAFNELSNDKNFINNLYSFYKKEYESFHSKQLN